MNLKRIFIWGGFVVIIGLVIWGLIAAQNKAEREEAKVYLPGEVLSTDHFKGNENAKVTVVEYGDFQCPACAAYLPLVNKVFADVGSSTMRIVFRHFPLAQHVNGMPASKAAEASGKQGKFWEMHDILFENQIEWEKSPNPRIKFVEYAKALGLDIDKFSSDFDSKEVSEKINNDYKSGIAAKINATPTFFVNGEKIENPQTYEQFKKIIEDTALKASI